jgi:hypothetical protein
MKILKTASAIGGLIIGDMQIANASGMRARSFCISDSQPVSSILSISGRSCLLRICILNCRALVAVTWAKRTEYVYSMYYIISDK